ncbi:SdrD B-like domain-containing protein [Isosphaeraceae bacterium EP7]
MPRTLISPNLRPRRPASPRGLRQPRSLKLGWKLGVEGLEERMLLASTQVQLGSLLFSSANFNILGTQYTATGTTQVGFAPTQGEAFTPLVEIDGSVSFDTGSADSTFEIAGSTIRTKLDAGDVLVPLFQGTRSFNVGDLVGPGVSLVGDAVSVAGASLAFDEFRFNNPGSIDTTDSRVQLQGALTLPTFVGLTIEVDDSNYVNVAHSGISLTGVSATLTQTFSIAGLTVSAQGLSVSYSTSGTDDVFSLWGSAGIASTSGDLSLTADFGPSSAPGLTIVNGSLAIFDAAVSAGVSVGGATFGAQNLAIAYTPSQGAVSSYFAISGGPVSFAADGLSFSATLPGSGVQVSGGTLQDFDLSITGNASLAGATFDVTNLAITYAAAGQVFTLTGGPATFTADGLSFSASFPAAGVVVTNGTLSDFDFQLSGNASLAGATFDVTNLAIDYAAAGKVYKLTGGPVTFTAGGLSLSASFPGAGVVVSNGKLQNFDLTINGSASLGGLAFSIDKLTMAYTASQGVGVPSQVAITGGPVSFSDTAGQISFSASFPGQGLVVQGGQLQAFNLDLNGTAVFAGLTLNIKDLAFSYQDAGANSVYSVSGALSIAVSGSNISASLQGNYDNNGTSISAGLVIVGGTLEYVNMTLNGNLDLFGLAIDFDALNLVYVSEPGSTIYQITGGITVPELFNASVILGQGGQDGLTIDNGVVSIGAFTLALNDVQLGAFTIEQLDVNYAPNETFSVVVSVLFPQGWAIGGSIAFVNGKLDELSLSYSAATGEGIEIGDTGLFLNMMSATVQNIDQPNNLIVSGAMGIDFGGEVSIAGTSVTIFSAAGSFSVDKDGLTLDAGFAIGAISQTTPPPITTTPTLPEGLYGTGSGQVTLDWAQGLYQVTASFSMYDDVFQLTTSFTFHDLGDDQFALSLSAQADVRVPAHIPFIGGKELGQIDFLMDYNSNNGNPTGFVAAWVELDIVRKFDIGIEYEFSDASKTVKVIGTKSVNNLKNTPAPPPANQTYTFTTTFTIGDDQLSAGATDVTVQSDWGQSLISSNLVVMNPAGIAVVAQAVPAFSSASTAALHFVASASDPTQSLKPGTYTIVTTLVAAPGESVSQPTITATYHRFRPLVAVSGVQPGPAQSGNATISIGSQVDSAFASQTTVSLYSTPAALMGNGTLIGGQPVLAYTGPAMTANWNLDGLYPIPYVVYARINDGFNVPVFSATSASLTPTPILSGTVSDPKNGNVGISGIQVYIDVNGNGVFDSTVDPFTTTGPTGFYAFFSPPVTTGTFNVYVTVPQGFQLDAASTNPGVFVSQGNPVDLDFAIDELASVSGIVFVDLNNDGTNDPSDPGLPNISVVLDLNNNGQFDPGEPTTITNATGGYIFYNVPLNTNFSVIPTIPATYYLTTQAMIPSPIGNNPYQHDTGLNFGVLPYVTVSGTITGNGLTDAGLNMVETPLAGVTVTLSQNGQAVATTITDASGNYSFSGLAQGPYTITEAPGTQWQQTSPVVATFSFPGTTNQLFGSSGYPSGLAAADFNNDGIIDFASGVLSFEQTYNVNAIDIVLSNGTGSYQTYLDAVNTAAGNTQLLVAADVRSPGTPDIVVINVDGSVELLQNDGLGNFTDNPNYWQGLPSSIVSMASASGLFVSGSQSNGVAYVYENISGVGGGIVVLLPGGGAAQVLQANFVFPAGGEQFGLAVADMNGDTFPDIVTSDQNSLYIAYGTATGMFGSVTSYAVFTSQNPGGGPVAVADFNGDSMPDVAVVSGVAPFQVMILSQGGTQNWAVQAILAPLSLTNPQVVTNLVAADFNGDSLPDLAILPVNPNSGNPYPNNFAYTTIYLNDPGSTGGFDTSSPPTVFTGAGPVSLIATDLNGDGLPDLLYGDDNGSSIGSIGYLLNQSTITPQPISINVGGGIVNLTSQNFNNVQLGQINGTTYGDPNRSGVRDAGEVGKAGVTVYLDLNGNGIFDPGVDRSTVTTAGGYYAFSGLPDGTYTVRVIAGDGQALTGPAGGGYAVAVAGASQITARSFGMAPTLLAPIADVQVVAGVAVGVVAKKSATAGNSVLRYRLAPGAPVGASIDPTTGAFTWTPTLLQGGRSYSVTVLVSNPFRSTIHDSRTFTISVASVSSPTAFVYAVYQVIFGTTPTSQVAETLTTRLDFGVTRLDLVRALYDSTEHLGLQVDQFYTSYFKRAAQPAERDFWVTSMRGGLSTTALAAKLLGSNEYRASHTSPDAFIRGLYRDVLGTNPSPREVNAWIRLAGGRFNSEGLARTFLNSRMATARLVTRTYLGDLGRAPSSAEARPWIRRLVARHETPESFVVKVLASDEFYARASRAAGLVPRAVEPILAHPRGPLGRLTPAMRAQAIQGLRAAQVTTVSIPMRSLKPITG